jgi:hypothetical protein
MAMAGCGFTTTEGELDTFAGEWCTLRGLGSDNLPSPDVAYVGATLIVDGNQVVGVGSTSRPGSDVVYPARYRGTVTGGQAVIEVGDLEAEPDVPGPQFTMVMRVVGTRDMEGTMAGDPDFVGSLQLVRLGPRCFVE